MNRDELAANLTAYIDGELPELEAKRLEEALKVDSELAALERTMRATLKAVEALPSPEPSQALRRAVLSRVAEKSAFQKLAAYFTLPRLVPAVGLAAAAAVAVVVWQPWAEGRPGLDPETLFVAQNIEVLEDLDVIGLEGSDDLDIVTSLHELEGTP
ncbi:MAG: zf-HC2 domain-containing protein [Myxococcaceae bacterium]|nr:zf-HC2 domain-containing protein [Myxococcaceae bacterium]